MKEEGFVNFFLNQARNQFLELFLNTENKFLRNRDFHENVYTISLCIDRSQGKDMKNFLCQRNLFADLRLTTHLNNLRGFDLLLTLIHCWKSTFYPGDIKLFDKKSALFDWKYIICFLFELIKSSCLLFLYIVPAPS